MTKLSKGEDKKLRQIGEKVCRAAGVTPEETFGSVIAILMVISIILTVIRVIQECKKDEEDKADDVVEMYGEEIRTLSLRRGWFTKLRVKRLLRRNMSPEQFEKHGLKLLSAILHVGEHVDHEEVEVLLTASKALD